MNTKPESRMRLWGALVCLASAALILMLCSKSSFLYPLNDWEDANIIFTVGRGLMQGRVPFRDLYDQKGPVAYLVYGLASLVSSRSFIGLYLIETLCFTGFLYASWRTIALYEEKNALLCVPLLGALVASAMSFAHGGSVEELALPALAFSLYDLLKTLRHKQGMPLYRILLHGLLAGLLLWMKYTMLGFYIAFIAVLFFSLCADKRIVRAFSFCGIFLCGMLLATLPWLLYFYRQDALGDMWNYYFIYNIFGYGSDGTASRGILSILLNMGKNTLATFRRNPQYSLLIALGVLYLTLCPTAKADKREKCAIWALCVLTCMGIYTGELGLRYYGIVLTVFAALGFVPLIKLFNRYALLHLSGKNWTTAATVAALSLALCPMLSDNVYLIGQSRDALPQYRFAAVMEQRRSESTTSLISYQMMDAGFYLTGSYMPPFRCFTLLNNAHEEILTAQNQQLDEGVTEFVITRNRPLVHPNYAFVEEASYYYEEDYPIYRLYQRIDPQ